ncbi:MAG: aminotransferase class V-fold PLP-dependent enzyme [Actinomycetota bacterium]
MTSTGSNETIELDIDAVRAQFPALADPETAGPWPGGWVHLENAGGSFLPRQVVDLSSRYLAQWRIQPFAAAGPAKAAGEAMDRARALIPATFGLHGNGGADSDDGDDGADGDVHIGPSTSQNTYVLAQAIGAGLTPGDEVIVTNQDHEANIGAWRRLGDRGITVRQWSVDPETGLLDLADLEAIVGPRTRLVAVTHASNLAATVNPIRQVSDLAHTVGALVVVDGVAWAPHAAIDVADLGCDIYLYSTYKTYGPHQGLVWTRAGLADRLSNQGHWFNAGSASARLSPAGPNHAAVAALGGMIDYYEELYRHHWGPEHTGTTLADRIARVYGLVAGHEERLMTPLLEFLDQRGVRVIGSTSTSRADRAPTVAFDPGPVDGASVVEALADAGIGVGYGDFYARRLVEAMGLDGVVRISAVHYNTVEEIERTIAALDRVLAR